MPGPRGTGVTPVAPRKHEHHSLERHERDRKAGAHSPALDILLVGQASEGERVLAGRHPDRHAAAVPVKAGCYRTISRAAPRTSISNSRSTTGGRM